MINCHAGHVICVLTFTECKKCGAPYCKTHKDLADTCEHQKYKHDPEMDKIDYQHV